MDFFFLSIYLVCWTLRSDKNRNVRHFISLKFYISEVCYNQICYKAIVATCGLCENCLLRRAKPKSSARREISEDSEKKVLRDYFWGCFFLKTYFYVSADWHAYTSGACWRPRFRERFWGTKKEKTRSQRVVGVFDSFRRTNQHEIRLGRLLSNVFSLFYTFVGEGRRGNLRRGARSKLCSFLLWKTTVGKVFRQFFFDLDEWTAFKKHFRSFLIFQKLFFFFFCFRGLSISKKKNRRFIKRHDFGFGQWEKTPTSVRLRKIFTLRRFWMTNQKKDSSF